MQGRRIAALLVLLSFAAFSLAAEDALTTASLGATAAGDGTSVTGSSVTHIEDPTSEAAKSTEPIKSGNDLAEAVEANSEAQDYNEASKPVKAQVIKEEPAAMIASGTGDLDTTGPCQSEVDQFCFEVKPGEGRLAKCLKEQLSEQEKPGYADTKISATCQADLDKFTIDKAGNINADLPLANACVADADKLCKNLAKDVTVLGCLRDNKDQLTEECKAEVFERQALGADDWRADIELFNACETDANSQCSNVDPHGGKMQNCLREKRALLTWDCQEQLFRQEMENSDDLRLSVRLFKSCLADKRKFCPDVQPGNARAKECLEEHREEPDFSPECKTEVEKMMAERAADFRLDSKLKRLCQDDITDMCANERDSLDLVAGLDARVILCLQDLRDDIMNPGCKSRVLKIMEYASSDIRFDVPLAEACFEDRQEFCASVPPGSARVIRCLQDRREDLSYECSATLFDQEVDMAESIDFQFPMKKNCSTAIEKFCKDVPHGHARVIRCLQDNLENAAMPDQCKKEVADYTAKTANDYRLNYRLNTACHSSIAEKCADACSSVNIEQQCGGTVLQCLSDKIEEITDEDCKKEVFYFQKMEVRDFRNDVILAETCRTDVDTYCPDVEAGEGRVHKCLWDNKDKISPACQKEERKIQIMQSSNTELMPNLAKACKSERQSHCKGVRPGKSRLYNCLVSNSDSVDFTEACKEQLTRQQKKRVKDHRMDYDLRNGCKNDVPKVCVGDIKEEDKETGAVLKCLVKNAETVSDTCNKEISRSLRAAFQFYQPDLPVLDACDSDVEKLCLVEKGLNTYRVGEIRRCLNSHVSSRSPPESSQARRLRMLLQAVVDEKKEGKLGAQCESLVQLAEPGDAFSAFTASMNASAVAQTMKSIEGKFGLKEGTLAPKGRSGLTLTGWSAVMGILAIVAVAIGAGIHAYKKYYGLDGIKGYIRVKKGSKHPDGL